MPCPGILRVCRDEIAGCSEQAYLDLPIKEAARLMMFKSEDELTEYAAQVKMAWFTPESEQHTFHHMTS